MMMRINWLKEAIVEDFEVIGTVVTLSPDRRSETDAYEYTNLYIFTCR